MKRDSTFESVRAGRNLSEHQRRKKNHNSCTSAVQWTRLYIKYQQECIDIRGYSEQERQRDARHALARTVPSESAQLRLQRNKSRGGDSGSTIARRSSRSSGRRSTDQRYNRLAAVRVSRSSLTRGVFSWTKCRLRIPVRRLRKIEVYLEVHYLKLR